MTVFETLDRPIAFQRCLLEYAGSITATLFLSQAIYWSNRTTNEDGWFYKTRDEWQDETGLTRYEQQTARKKLVELGVLEERRSGVPAKMYFRLNADAFSSWWESNQLDGGHPTNKMAGNQPTITETTQRLLQKENIKRKIETNFAEFWSAYPKRPEGNSRSEALKSYKKFEGEHEKIMAGLERWKEANADNVKNRTFIPMASTWLNQRRWECEYAGRKDDFSLPGVLV